MRRPQVRSVAVTATLNVVTMLAGSMGGLILARTLGPTQRGDLVTILLWPAMIGGIVSLGITQATCYWASKQPELAADYMSTGVVASLLTGLIVAGSGPWIAELIGRNGEVRRYLTLVLALTPLYITGGVWISALQATRISMWNLARTMQPFLYLAGLLCLWMLGRLTIGTAVIVYAASLLIQIAFSIMVARRVVGRGLRPKRFLLRPLYSYGAKVSLSTVPQVVNASVDQLILSVMPGVSAAQLGNYAVAVSLSLLALPAAVAFGSVAFPRIARAPSEDHARRIERLSLVGAVLLAGMTIGIISALAPLVVPRIFGKGYSDAIIPLWLLAPGTIFLAVNRVLGDLLQGRGRPLMRSSGEGIGMVFTLVLLIILIPRFGIRGAAIASSVTYGVVCLFLLWGLHRSRTTAIAPV
jgi:O-antigen/teichoic acid export membrane protein